MKVKFEKKLAQKKGQWLATNFFIVLYNVGYDMLKSSLKNCSLSYK
jgi:hypothetical protein